MYGGVWCQRSACISSLNTRHDMILKELECRRWGEVNAKHLINITQPACWHTHTHGLQMGSWLWCVPHIAFLLFFRKSTGQTGQGCWCSSSISANIGFNMKKTSHLRETSSCKMYKMRRYRRWNVCVLSTSDPVNSCRRQKTDPTCVNTPKTLKEQSGVCAICLDLSGASGAEPGDWMWEIKVLVRRAAEWKPKPGSYRDSGFASINVKPRPPLFFTDLW